MHARVWILKLIEIQTYPSGHKLKTKEEIEKEDSSFLMGRIGRSQSFRGNKINSSVAEGDPPLFQVTLF